MVDTIEFADTPRAAGGVGYVKAQRDFGTMALAALGAGAPPPPAVARAQLPARAGRRAICDGPRDIAESRASPAHGTVSQPFALKPGQSATVTFVIAWHFPNPLDMGLKTDHAARVRRPLRVGVGRCGLRPPAHGAADAADAPLARHLVRLDPAVLVPGPDVPEHLHSGDQHRLPPVRRALLRLRGDVQLPRHLYARLGLCAGPGAPVPGAAQGHAAAGPPDARHRHPRRRRHPGPLARLATIPPWTANRTWSSAAISPTNTRRTRLS